MKFDFPRNIPSLSCNDATEKRYSILRLAAHRYCSSRDCTRSRQKGRGRGWKVVVLSVGGWLRRLVLLAIQPLLGIEVTGSLLRNTNSRNKLAESREPARWRTGEGLDPAVAGLFSSRGLESQCRVGRTGVKFCSFPLFIVASSLLSSTEIFKVYFHGEIYCSVTLYFSYLWKGQLWLSWLLFHLFVYFSNCRVRKTREKLSDALLNLTWY